MRYLKFSRGLGSGLVFRMKTPLLLLGALNPMTGKLFGREITMGLGTRRLAEARDKRDILLGRITELRNQAQGRAVDPRWSIETARGWRADIAKQEREGIDEDDVSARGVLYE